MNKAAFSYPVYLDIETIPDQSSDALKREIDAVRPPGNIKKADSVKAWLEENAEAEGRNRYLKTALDGGKGQIICICIAVDDGPVRRFYNLPESMIISRMFSSLIAEIGRDMVQFVAHNAPFDLGFLRKRCIIHGIRPPYSIDVSRYSKSYYDTMTEWAGFGQYISLDELCRQLAITSPKTGMTGADVYDAYCAGRIEEIAEYCANDVQAVRAIHRKMTFAEVLK